MWGGGGGGGEPIKAGRNRVYLKAAADEKKRYIRAEYLLENCRF